MAEPKGGPVKPPILDLKPVKSSSTSKSASPAPRATRVNNPRPESVSTKQANPASGKNRQKPTKAQESAKAQESQKQPHNNKADTTPPTSKKPSISPHMIALLGALGGAALALIITIPLILSGLLQPANQIDLAPQLQTRIEDLDKRVGINREQITQSLVGFNVMDEQVNALRQLANNQNEHLQNQIERIDEQQLDFGLQQDISRNTQNDLKVTLDNLQAPPPLEFDPTSLINDITRLDSDITHLNNTLGARIDAIAAGASPQDAEKLAVDMGEIRQNIATINSEITTRFEKLENDIANNITNNITLANEQLSSLDARIAATIATSVQNQSQINQQAEILEQLQALDATQPQNPPTTQNSLSDIAPIPANTINLHLPLALMGMQLAINSGKPFSIELQSISTLLPDLDVPQNLEQGALVGLVPPIRIINNFNHILPEMLASRPPTPNANWQQRMLDTMKSVLALRPTSLTGGDPIENLVAQIEAAINRQDFINARHLINLLPPPMFAALGDISEQVSVMGNATRFLDLARARILLTSQNNSELTEIAQ